MADILKITISGNVQGVFFRSSAKKKALELQLTGFVKNLGDGLVYIEAQGSTKNLEDFIDWCHIGPRHANVRGVHASRADQFSIPTIEPGSGNFIVIT